MAKDNPEWVAGVDLPGTGGNPAAEKKDKGEPPIRLKEEKKLARITKLSEPMLLDPSGKDLSAEPLERSLITFRRRSVPPC